MSAHAIFIIRPGDAGRWRDGLIELLVDAVEGGASVNFVWPMTQEKAARFWDAALAGLARGERFVFGAEAGGRLDGTVMLMPAPQENQAFRADIGKLLVHRRARRLGLARRLMAAAEDEARRQGRTLLTLDTEAGSVSDGLYDRLGWTRFGQVPGYATSPDGTRRDAANFYYKEL